MNASPSHNAASCDSTARNLDSEVVLAVQEDPHSPLHKNSLQGEPQALAVGPMRHPSQGPRLI